MRFLHWVFVGICTVCAVSVSPEKLCAEFTSVRWAGSVNVLAGQAATGAPDGIGAPIGQLVTSNFQTTSTYSGLAALLGVSEVQLLQADVIAFDVQGLTPGQGAGPNNGFESAQFIVGDSLVSATINHDESLTSLRPGVLATGTLTSAQLNGFFGSNTTFSNSWILLDVPSIGIDKDSPFFFSQVTGGSSLGFGGEGSPDLDAIGLLNVTAVPEPSSFVLFAASAVALGYRRFRRQNHTRKLGLAVSNVE